MTRAAHGHEKHRSQSTDVEMCFGAQLPFLDTYRTFLVAPDTEVIQVLQEVRVFLEAA